MGTRGRRVFRSPASAFWTTSGLAMIAVIVGGARSLLGPAVGAMLVVLLQLGLSSLPARGLAEHWELLLGAVHDDIADFLPATLELAAVAGALAVAGGMR